MLRRLAVSVGAWGRSRAASPPSRGRTSVSCTGVGGGGPLLLRRAAAVEVRRTSGEAGEPRWDQELPSSARRDRRESRRPRGPVWVRGGGLSTAGRVLRSAGPPAGRFKAQGEVLCPSTQGPSPFGRQARTLSECFGGFRGPCGDVQLKDEA